MKITITHLLFFFSLTVYSQTKVFNGAWFEIKYPSNFTAIGSLKSISADGFESAIFKSPDGLVEFYIFSPQWGGEYSDINLKSNEKLQSTETKIIGEKTIKYWTIADKNAKYIRSYQETKDESTNWVIGIKYKDQIAYNKYKQMYLKFKLSLKQFAD